MASAEGERDGDGVNGGRHRIRLDVPASYASLRVLRLVVADAVDDAGLSVERIERAGVVVDELAALLVAEGAGERMTFQVVRSASSVEIEGVIASDGSAGEAPVVDEVVRELLDVGVGGGRWSVAREDRLLRVDAAII